MLVGAQVNIHVAWKAGLAGVAVIGVGLVFRSVGTWVSLIGTGYTVREKLFCVVAYIPKATVQTAIGAVPMAAGVASGELILAIAVLSILTTAPIGAIGIMLMGERILDYGEASTYRFKDLRAKLELPRVGERARSKRYNTVWKIIEEKEIWLPPEAAAGVSEDSHPHLIPAIELRYWKEDLSRPGSGKTMKFRYSSRDPSFQEHWEVLYDW